MQADLVEVSWDYTKSKWLVRIEAGEEVLRRHSDLERNAPDQLIRTDARQIAQDEGYESPENILIIRPAAAASN
jgi:hypothetical protein